VRQGYWEKQLTRPPSPELKRGGRGVRYGILHLMKTAGQILQAARITKRFEYEDVSRITKIRPIFLSAIEADDYSKLLSGTVARGFIRNYCEFLGLNPETVLAVFRRDFIENSLGRIVPRGLADPVAKPSLWTPKTTIIALVILVFTLFGAYIVYQYRLLTGPPSLDLTSPADRQVTSEVNVEIIGRTDPDASLSVNGQLQSLDKGGRFYFRIPLNPGENKIDVTATAKSGKTTTLTRTITLR